MIGLNLKITQLYWFFWRKTNEFYMKRRLTFCRTLLRLLLCTLVHAHTRIFSVSFYSLSSAGLANSLGCQIFFEYFHPPRFVLVGGSVCSYLRVRVCRLIDFFPLATQSSHRVWVRARVSVRVAHSRCSYSMHQDKAIFV